MSLYVDVEKKLGKFLLRVKFETNEGVLAILGASGCGKSMTLKCIAGIETPDRGRIVLNDRVLFDSEQRINLKPQKRLAGYLFQQYALFPNMTVLQNVMCGIREGSKEEKRKEALKMLDRLHLSGHEEKKPSMLSGGQQQRCALARILVNEPEVLLLDEPFSALDAHLRFHTERQVANILEEFGKPVVFVSHDRDEVFRLTDRIAVMENGKIYAMGDKHRVFDDPGTIGGAILTGCKNISTARITGPDRIFAEEWGIELCTETVPEDLKGVGIRMHDIEIRKADSSGENEFSCRIGGEIENPFSYSIMLYPEHSSGGRYILIDLSKEKWNQIRSEHLCIHIPREAVLLLH